MSIEKITHNHLRKILDDNYEYLRGNGEISDDDFEALINELFYSVLIAPTKTVNGETFPIWIGDENGNQFLPLFTDLAEYQKEFAGFEDFHPGSSDFDTFLNAGIDNIVINPSSEQFAFPVDAFKDKPEIPLCRFDPSEDTLDEKGLRNLLDSKSTLDLDGAYDYEAFFSKLAESVVFMVPKLKEDMDVHDGIIKIAGGTPVSVSFQGYLEIYTDKDEIKRDGERVAAVVNLEKFIDYLIRMDFSGLVINPNSDAVVLDRTIIMKNFDEFRKNYNSSRYAMASEYAFII